MRRRLALSFAAVTTMVVLAFVLPLGVLVQRVAADRALSAAQQQAVTLAPVLALVDDPDTRREVVSAAAAAGGGDLTVFLPDGDTVGAAARADDSVILARKGRAFTAPAAGGRAVLVPVVDAGGTQVIRVFVSNGQLREGVVRSWALLGLLAVLLVAVAVAVGDRLARTFVRPIRDLAGVAGDLSEGRLDARVTPSGPPELVEVAHAQNHLASRIVALLAAERERAADLSHRLRTPITALRLDAEALGDPVQAERIGAGVDALTRAVNAVIADARKPAEDTALQSTDLVAATRARVAFWAALAEEEGRPYRLDVPAEPRPVPVRTVDLDAMLDALLGNIFAHTPPGTAFTVTVEARPDAPTRLVVRDDGPGMAEGSVVRGASDAGSTGLGLDIVRRTAESSGGRLDVRRSPSGGASVEVEFGPAG